MMTNSYQIRAALIRDAALADADRHEMLAGTAQLTISEHIIRVLRALVSELRHGRVRALWLVQVSAPVGIGRRRPA